MMNEPYAGATPDQLRHPLVQEFLAIHNMFRSELGRMLTFVNQLIDGEAQLNTPETTHRTHMLIRTGRQYTQLLHFHHHAESSHLFPALHEQGLETEIITRLESDHDEISVLIDKFSDAIRDFSAVQPAVLDNDLRRLSEALQAHLAYEETHICPVITRLSNWPAH